VSKETHYSVKSEVSGYVPTGVEIYYIFKRDLLQCQKRPIIVSKETGYVPIGVSASKKPNMLTK
jgi:hypothetical protein